MSLEPNPLLAVREGRATRHRVQEVELVDSTGMNRSAGLERFRKTVPDPRALAIASSSELHSSKTVSSLVTDRILLTDAVGVTSVNSPPHRRSLVRISTSSPRPRASIDASCRRQRAILTWPSPISSLIAVRSGMISASVELTIRRPVRSRRVTSPTNRRVISTPTLTTAGPDSNSRISQHEQADLQRRGDKGLPHERVPS